MDINHMFVLKWRGEVGEVLFHYFDQDRTNSMEQIQHKNPPVLALGVGEHSWRNRHAPYIIIFLTCSSSIYQFHSNFFFNFFVNFENVLEQNSSMKERRNFGDCEFIPWSVMWIQLCSIINVKHTNPILIK